VLRLLDNYKGIAKVDFGSGDTILFGMILDRC
jgi:hypothetical protein